MFLSGYYNKLKLKKRGPCRVLKRMLDNSYNIYILKKMDISPILNVVDLYKYHEGGKKEECAKHVVD